MQEQKTENRFLAAFAHLAALGLGMGLVIPAALWSEQRGKSKYLTFQCLQAYGYQSLGYSVWLVMALLLFTVTLLATPFALGVVASGPPDSRIVVLFIGALFIPELLLLAIYMILPILAAIACGQGKEYRYPILGKRLAAYLGYTPDSDITPLNQVNEERWAAAMGHFAVVIMLWGILAPVMVWVTLARRSSFLAVQSVQSFVVQVVCTVIYFGTSAGIVLVVLPLFPLALAPDTQVAPWMALSLLAALIMAFAVALAVPLFQIIGQWAGLQILRGHDYRYPWIGHALERWALAHSQKESDENPDRG